MIQIWICSLINAAKKKTNKYHIISYDKNNDMYSKKWDIALLIFHRGGATCKNATCMSALAVKVNLKMLFCVRESTNGHNRVAQLYTILIPLIELFTTYMSSLCDVWMYVGMHVHTYKPQVVNLVVLRAFEIHEVFEFKTSS